MVGGIIQIVSLVTVVVTLYFAAAQTRKLEKQVNISNLFSRYEVLNHASERYEAALALVFQRPELRPYLFERKPLDLSGEALARALTIADLMAGAVDYAVRVGSRFPEDARSGWTEVAEVMARQPLFQRIVNEQPHHFPDLMRFFAAHTATGLPATTSPGDRIEPDQAISGSRS
ncbi:hypothetical protein ABZ570_30150 [Micromonospora sp. NPDC007271]|uniref:hypothetical protein n=1 Tax=Micromonospora sp. NPDC007271 TaxID=3154587 RepID=UPI00340C83A6